jgi:hypothetical protein
MVEAIATFAGGFAIGAAMSWLVGPQQGWWHMGRNILWGAAIAVPSALVALVIGWGGLVFAVALALAVGNACLVAAARGAY